MNIYNDNNKDNKSEKITIYKRNNCNILSCEEYITKS